MKVVIVEDEAIAARRMRRLLEDLDLEVVAAIQSCKELKKHVQEGIKVDLYFCDIHLSDGLVFEVLKENPLSAPIIFTTAYDQYAIQAFKQDSIDYLLKPIDEDELGAAITRFKKRQPETLQLSALTNLLSSQKSQKTCKTRWTVKVGDKIKLIPLEEILFFYSDSKVNFLYTTTGRSYPLDHTMQELQDQVSPEVFYRVNRGHLIKVTAIKELIAYSNSRLKVKIAEAPDHEIIVSREKVKDFKEWLG